MDLLSYAKIPPAVLQVEVHPYLTQQALLDFCKASNIHVTAFSPLGSGSYIELGMDFGLGVGVLKEPSVLEIAAAVGKTAAQVALRWGVQRYQHYPIRSSCLPSVLIGWTYVMLLGDALLSPRALPLPESERISMSCRSSYLLNRYHTFLGRYSKCI